MSLESLWSTSGVSLRSTEMKSSLSLREPFSCQTRWLRCRRSSPPWGVKSTRSWCHFSRRICLTKSRTLSASSLQVPASHSPTWTTRALWAWCNSQHSQASICRSSELVLMAWLRSALRTLTLELSRSGTQRLCPLLSPTNQTPTSILSLKWCRRQTQIKRVEMTLHKFREFSTTVSSLITTRVLLMLSPRRR